VHRRTRRSHQASAPVCARHFLSHGRRSLHCRSAARSFSDAWVARFESPPCATFDVPQSGRPARCIVFTSGSTGTPLPYRKTGSAGRLRQRRSSELKIAHAALHPDRTCRRNTCTVRVDRLVRCRAPTRSLRSPSTCGYRSRHHRGSAPAALITTPCICARSWPAARLAGSRSRRFRDRPLSRELAYEAEAVRRTAVGIYDQPN